MYLLAISFPLAVGEFYEGKRASFSGFVFISSFTQSQSCISQFFLPATHRALSYHVHFSLFLCLLLLLPVSVECRGGRKWLYFPRQQVLIFVVATQTWQSLSRIQQLSQEIWKSCSPLARNLLFLRQTAAATPELWHGETLGYSSLFHFPVPSTSRVFILYITSLFSFSWKSFVCWVPPSLLSNPCASLKGLS